MRKITTILACMGFLIFGMVGGAGAYTQTITLNTPLFNNDSYSWQHATPADFEVPYDIVNAATLDITAFDAGQQNAVVVQGTLVGTLETGFWSWSNSSFNIKDIFVTWQNGSPLNVTVTALDNFLYLGTSTFTLDYANGNPSSDPIDPPADNAPVPEPATMLLLGSGLASLGLWGKRKKLAV